VISLNKGGTAMKAMNWVSQAGVLALVLTANFAASAAETDFSGKWSVTGSLTSGRTLMTIGTICDIKQVGDQIVGPCKGPNGGCSAVGIVSGASVDWTCRTQTTNAPGLAGYSTFHGALGGDAIVRGAWTHSTFPGANGQFAMQKI
jgi:hypothetical protein